MAIHLEHGSAIRADGDLVSGFREAAEECGHVAADRVFLLRVRLVALEIQPVACLWDRHPTRDFVHALGIFLELSLELVELVAERSYDFLKRVFAKCEANCGAALVDDRSAVLPL